MLLIAGILLTDGLKYIEDIRIALMGGALLFTLAGFAEGSWAAGEDMKGQLFNLLKVAIIASLVVGFPTMIQQGDQALDALHASVTQKQGIMDQQEQDAFQQQITTQAIEPSIYDVAGRLIYSTGKCLQKIGLLGYQIVYWAKDVSILLLISVSPLLIGFLAFSYTRSIGINFLITSFTVILWNVGFAIVDILLITLGKIIMPIMGAGTAGVVGSAVVTVGPQFLVMCLVAAVLPITMYCAVPIITGAIMRGTNIAGAAMGAYGMAHQAVSHGGGMAASAGASGAGSLISALKGASITGLVGESLSHGGSSLSSSNYGSSGPFMTTTSSTSSSTGSNNSPQSSGIRSSAKADSSNFANNEITNTSSVGSIANPSLDNITPQAKQEPISDVAGAGFNAHENSPYMA